MHTGTSITGRGGDAFFMRVQDEVSSVSEIPDDYNLLPLGA